MSNLVTQFFSVDHERLDFLFRMYRKSKKENRYIATLLFEKFSDDLKQHINWEETLLFPAFDGSTKLTPSSPTYIMREEHKTIIKLLDKIRSSLIQDVNSDVLESQLTEFLLQHNEQEEQVLYGKCDKAISEEKLLEIFLEL